jgi:hypothetical protein
MRAYFFIRHADYVRNFEWLLRELARRGHAVHLAFGFEKGELALAQGLADEFPGLVTIGYAPIRFDLWQPLEWKLRAWLDYLRYRGPAYRDADYLRERARRGVAPAIQRLAEREPAAALVERLLRLAIARIPPLPALAGEPAARDADVVIVTPLVSEPAQHAFAASAHAAGRPVALAVHSWDNLTNKGLVQFVPDRTYVWNAVQQREAVELHGLPADSVVAVGAHSYDHWFDWRAARDREAFCAEVGLDPARPFLLYVGSSKQIAPDERPIIRAWIERLRRDPRLREVGVLVRPHPSRGPKWDDDPFADLGDVVVFPRHGAQPQNEQRRADYYDSIHHAAAVVGLNTSALIEAAIVGRRTYTFVVEGGNTQEGTLHFHYLLSENGGPLVAARTLDEHVDDLAGALTADTSDDDWRRPFLESFLRPHGLDAAGAPLLADDLERVAASERRPQVPVGARAVAAALLPAALLMCVLERGRLPVRGEETRTPPELPRGKPFSQRAAKELRRRRKRARQAAVRRVRRALAAVARVT